MEYLKTIDNYCRFNYKTGLISVNHWRRAILPAFLYFDPSDTPDAFTINAAGTQTSPTVYNQKYASAGNLDVGMGTPFEVKNILYEDTTDTTDLADWTVDIREVGQSRLFMNQPQHVRNFAGIGQFPARLKEPYMFFSSHFLQINLAKIAGNATAIRMYLEGAQYYPYALLDSPDKTKIINYLKKWKERQKYVFPFWLTTDTVLTAAANSSATAFAKIGGDAHFEGFYICSVQTGQFRFEISNPRTGQTLMNGTVENNSGLGTVRQPTYFPVSYLIPNTDSLKFSITDLSGSENTVRFCIAGRKIQAPLKEVKDVLCDTAVTQE